MDAGRLLLLLSHETYRATDFLAAARRVGVELVVGTDVPLAFSDRGDARYLTLPFHDPDEAVARARQLNDDVTLTGVVAADDEPVVAAAAIAQALGLRGHAPDAAARTRDKLAQREALAAAGLPGPRYAWAPARADVERAGREVGFPCVVKPLGLNASRGVVRADDDEGLRAAADRVFDLLDREPGVGRGGVLLESFLPGEEVALEALLLGGRLEVLALFDKPDPLDGPFFEETLYITPSRHPPAWQGAARDAVAAAAQALGLQDGPVHAEARLHEGRATLVEVAARTIGGLCGRTLRFGAGMSLEEVVLRAALGRPPLTLDRERAAAGVLMLPIPARGTLRGVEGIDAARAVPGVWDVTITAPVGQEVVPLPEGKRYLGFAFARAEAPDGAEGALREVQRLLQVKIDPPVMG